MILLLTQSGLLRALHRARAVIALFSCAAMLLSGCAAAPQRRAIPWATAILVHPAPTPRSLATSDDSVQALDLQPEMSPPPSPLAAMRVVPPPRPRVAASPPSPENSTLDSADAPAIVPELSPADAAALKQQTNQSLHAAERNLASTLGKQLNTAQADIASKVRSFLAEARQAARAGDWMRARNLAKKAQVLSEELAGSL